MVQCSRARLMSASVQPAGLRLLGDLFSTTTADHGRCRISSRETPLSPCWPSCSIVCIISCLSFSFFPALFTLYQPIYSLSYADSRRPCFLSQSEHANITRNSFKAAVHEYDPIHDPDATQKRPTRSPTHRHTGRKPTNSPRARGQLCIHLSGFFRYIRSRYLSLSSTDDKASVSPKYEKTLSHAPNG